MKPSGVLQLRTQLGWSQGELARVLGVADLSVRRWENGSSQVTGTAAVVLGAIQEALLSHPEHAHAQLQRALRLGGIGAFLYVRMTEMFPVAKLDGDGRFDAPRKLVTPRKVPDDSPDPYC